MGSKGIGNVLQFPNWKNKRESNIQTDFMSSSIVFAKT